MKKNTRMLIDNHWRDYAESIPTLFPLFKVGISIRHIGILELEIRRSHASIEILGIEICFIYRPDTWPW